MHRRSTPWIVHSHKNCNLIANYVSSRIRPSFRESSSQVVSLWCRFFACCWGVDVSLRCPQTLPVSRRWQQSRPGRICTSSYIQQFSSEKCYPYAKGQAQITPSHGTILNGSCGAHVQVFLHVLAAILDARIPSSLSANTWWGVADYHQPWKVDRCWKMPVSLDFRSIRL